MGSWPHDTVVDAVAPTVEDTPFPATVIDRTVFPRARAASSARRESPRTSPGARTRPVRALVVAALVLALVAAYAFGVLGRDTAVGGVRPSAMTD